MTLTKTRSALTKLRSESMTTLVRRELERMVETGELTAGSRLNENALAARLGVSRGPIREACRGLEQGGLVTLIANRGFFIRELESREAAELYEIRAVLYGLAGRVLAPKITQKQAAELQGYIDAMQGAIADADLNVFYPNNLRFHEALVQFSGSERLRQECVSIHREMHLFRRRTLDLPGRMAISNDEHRTILKRLVEHDAEGAATELERHVLTSREVLFGPLGAYPRKGS